MIETKLEYRTVLNWKRGVFRLWLALSLAWACVAGFYEYKQGFGMTMPPPDKVIEAAAYKATTCIGYEPGTDNYTQVVEDLRAADKANNLPEATRLAKIAAKHWTCEGKPSDGSFEQTIDLTEGPNDTWTATVPTGSGPSLVIADIPKTIDSNGLALRVFGAIKDLQRHERLTAYAGDAAVALIPPFVLLLFGVTLAWILAGFKKQ